VNRKRIGFHQEKSHNLVAIDDCLVGHEMASRFAHAAPIDVSTKSIMVRVNAAGDVLLQIDQVDDTEALVAWAKGESAIQSVYVGRHHVHGAKGIVETILGMECMIGAESFFQVHTAQAATMFQTALSWVDLTGKTVIDAYAGVGIIGMLASQTAASVIGIESVTAAIHEAKQNIERNGITNMTMRQGLVELVLPKLESADVFVLDPPRSGMDALTIDTLLITPPKEILYFSCDPGTLSRDLKKLLTVYSIKQLQSFDMFSQTYHVETAVLLEKTA
jgi:23S rRNA (uracil-5-)-methyltransferase RumA